MADKKKPAKPRKDNDNSHDLEAHLQDLTADLQRVQADFVNYKRRADEERQRAVAIGREQVLLELLPILDNLERALSHLPEDLNEHQWAKGVVSVAKQLDSALGSVGVEKIKAVGSEFDPNLHEAVTMEEGEGEREVVVAELQAGYLLNGSVLRPSMVRVGRAK